MAKRLRSYLRTAAIVGAAAVAVAALSFLPPVDHVLGGIFAHSADGAAVANYPEQLHKELKRHERSYVEYPRIPAVLQQALISVEDKRFLRHGGIDPIALVRALAQDAQNDHVDHGGATISLQLARMILQIPRRQPSAIAELASQLQIMRASLILEHDFSKQKILELYLNGVYFGHGATGVAAAAEAYFHVPVEQLNEAQCIYMAGLPNNPGRFGADPSGDAATARYRHVIATMVHNGYLTERKAAALDGLQLFGGQ